MGGPGEPPREAGQARRELRGQAAEAGLTQAVAEGKLDAPNPPSVPPRCPAPACFSSGVHTFALWILQ